ncbi:hypothetical protein XELAEV_18001326mg [Xenopus laevis]|nr:hypothetical protein XELAEV_18001326mg [Xenopus laevis]
MDPAVTEEMVKGMENFQFTMGHIEGVSLPSTLCDVWDSICNFQAREDDILIATYPKAGPVLHAVNGVIVSSLMLGRMELMIRRNSCDPSTESIGYRVHWTGWNYRHNYSTKHTA